jgi:hypothetical protein
MFFADDALMVNQGRPCKLDILTCSPYDGRLEISKK